MNSPVRSVRFDPRLDAAVDAFAARRSITRSQAIAHLIALGLVHEHLMASRSTGAGAGPAPDVPPPPQQQTPAVTSLGFPEPDDDAPDWDPALIDDMARYLELPDP